MLSILFNLFLEKIVLETLQYYCTSISIGGRPLCNPQFPSSMGISNSVLQDLTSRHVDRATAYGMEVSTEKSKIMTCLLYTSPSPRDDY